MIVIDSNEASKNPWLVEWLSKKVEVRVESLPCGDILIGDTLIERKTVKDFVNSLRGRIWEQLDCMLNQENVQPILLIEGYWALYRKTRWRETSVLAALDTISVKMGVPVIMTPDKKGTLAYLLWKATKTDKRRRRVIVEKKPKDLKGIALRIVASLPGVSVIRGESLLRKFGSLRALFNASKEELMEVEGIGEKTAEEIERVITFNYEE